MKEMKKKTIAARKNHHYSLLKIVNIHIVKINVFSSAPELTAENKMIPVLNYGIKCMSIGLLVNLNIFNLIDVI